MPVLPWQPTTFRTPDLVARLHSPESHTQEMTSQEKRGGGENRHGHKNLKKYNVQIKVFLVMKIRKVGS